jgi:predicted 3-demethylubiquinone-9 3-methyltransferase (glyoxalase superfamily)
MEKIEKITPFLWFANEAEEAAGFYVSIFPDSELGPISRYGSEGYETHQMPEGTAMTVSFKLCGQTFTALNGGPVFLFNEAISFVIHCKDQEETDYYWNHLTTGGKEQPCGWLKDRYGLSWQVVPNQLIKYLSQPDRAAAGRAMQAMLKMKKIIIAELEAASADNK